MMLTLMSAMLVAAAPIQETDTTVSVNPNARLRIELMRGDVTIRTWSRPELRVVGDLGSRERLDVSTGQAVVRVGVRGGHGMAEADLEITMPATMSVEMEGPFLDVDIRGSEGEVSVETVQGDIHLEGGRRFVNLQSVQGDVDCSGATGRLSLGSVNGDVDVSDASGEITLEAVNGEIRVNSVQSEAVEATTLNGEIYYSGTIRETGQYSFTTHNGDLVITIPEGTNATVSVSTQMGEFEADFPITLQDVSPRRRFNFVLGNGGARLQLETFGGTIQLRRP